MWVEEERLYGWNGGKTLTSLTRAFQLEILYMRRIQDLHRSFGKNVPDLGVFDHKESHDRHPDDVPSLFGVSSGVIFQR